MKTSPAATHRIARAFVRPGYDSLVHVLVAALDQAQAGKGLERHASGEDFEDQQICQIPQWQGSVDFPLGQAVKKCLEVNRLPNIEAKEMELLGAINYIAAAVIVLRESEQNAPLNSKTP
jgi:hypothetical protein